MGVITDFFLASTSDVARVLTGWQLPPKPAREWSSIDDFHLNSAHLPLRGQFRIVPPPRPNPAADPAPQIDSLPNVQCHGMLPDKLALLFASLAEIPAERALDLILLGYLTGPPEPEVTVQRLPTALTSALATADTESLVRAAHALEEDDRDRWDGHTRGTAADLIQVLDRLRALAQRGMSSNADLFLWTST